MAAKIFIDGSAGTTGLRIHERLGARTDIEIITLPEAQRKEASARAKALNSCDIAFLCLPDAAAIEAVSMIENPAVKVIDTSTAHRTAEGWAYGFPELGPDFYEGVKNADRVAVPGCHASGFIALVHPLIQQGIISPATALTCHSVTGYSGGGKKMIAQYEDAGAEPALLSPRQYGLTQQHKHLKEMKAISGTSVAPIFCPIVSNFYSGMVVTVPLFAKDLMPGKTPADVKAAYAARYNSGLVKYEEEIGEEGFLCANALSGKDNMQIFVQGNEERMLLMTRYDNLGKGASGAAVECLNILLGADPMTGLEI